VTLFYAVLFPDGRLTYCNAGHNAPMLVSKDGGVQRLEIGGMVIGLFDGTPFEEASVQLQPDDFIVVFSDGVSEAMDAQEEEFGDDRLLESLAAMTATEVESQLKHVFASVSTFTAGADQNDDVTAMVVGYRGTSASLGRPAE
jgi:sigma-B regulation protein RsbU (phosphoserine phosphatase)